MLLGINLALDQKKFFYLLDLEIKKEIMTLVKRPGVIPLDVTNIESVRDAVIYCKPSIIIHAAAPNLLIFLKVSI